jgi:hypothetical protein
MIYNTYRVAVHFVFLTVLFVAVTTNYNAIYAAIPIDTLFLSQQGSNRPFVVTVAVDDSVLMRASYNDSTMGHYTIYHSTDSGTRWDSLSMDSIYWVGPLPSSYCSIYGSRVNSGSFVHVFSDGSITEFDYEDKGLPSALSVEYCLPDPRVKGRYFAVCYKNGSASNVQYLFVLDDLNSTFREVPTPRHSVGTYRKLALRFDYSDLNTIIIDVDGNNPINSELPYERYVSTDWGANWERAPYVHASLFGLFRKDYMFGWTTKNFQRWNPVLTHIYTEEADTLEWHDPIESVLSSYVDTSKYRVELMGTGSSVESWRELFFVQVNDPRNLIVYATAIPEPDLGLLPRLFFGVHSNDFGNNWTMFLEPYSYDSAQYERDIVPIGVITTSGRSLIPFNHYLRDTNRIRKSFLRSYVLSSVLVTSADDTFNVKNQTGFPFPQPAQSVLHVPFDTSLIVSRVQIQSTRGSSIDCAFMIESSQLVVDISRLPTGVYSLLVHTNSTVASYLVSVLH